MDVAAVRARVEGLPPSERKQAEKLLAEYLEAQEVNPLHRFHACPTDCGRPGCRPHPKQHEFLSAHTRLKAFFGGNRSGKTTAAVVDNLIQALDEEWLPNRLKPYKRWAPPFKCRIVGPDFTEWMETVLFDKLREWCPRDALLGGSWETAYSKQTRKLRFANGSIFSFMTFEQDVDKFGGSAHHRIHYDEEPPEAIRKECRMRLTDHGGDELFTMTPLHGMSWMFDGVWERRFEDGVSVVQVDMDDNPHLAAEDKEAVLEGLTVQERQARKEGRFVHFAGLVFPEFTEQRHIVPPVSQEHLQDQTIVVGLDPGINYAGAVWIAFDGENRAVAFEELFQTDTDIERMVAAVKEINGEWGLEPDYYVIDPSARNRTLATDAERPEAEFYRFGLTAIVRGQNDHETGAFQIKRRLQADPPSLLIAENCVEFVKEIARARKADTPDGTFKLLKESSANARNEVLDAARYALMSRPWMWLPGRDEPKHKPWTPGTAMSFEQLESAGEPVPQLI